MYLMGLSQYLSWRKGWDSNPRTGSSPITRFRVERVTASSLPFHKRVLYTKTGPRASLFSGALPQTAARALPQVTDAAGRRAPHEHSVLRAAPPRPVGGKSRFRPAVSPPLAEKKDPLSQSGSFFNVLQIGAAFRRNAAAAALRAEVCGVRPCRRAAAL